MNMEEEKRAFLREKNKKYHSIQILQDFSPTIASILKLDFQQDICESRNGTLDSV